MRESAFCRIVSPFHAPGRQPLHKELLTGNEHDQNRNQAEYRQSKYIPPLGELMLPEESGDGNRKCPFQFIVDLRFSSSLITVLAQGNSSHAVRKLKMEIEAIPGLVNGRMT